MLTTEKIKNARTGARIRDYVYNDLAKEVAKVVTLAHATRGSKAEPNDVQITACELANKLREDFPKLYYNEFELAIREGIYSGKKMFGLNAVDLYGLVRDYCADELVRNSRYESEPVALIQADTRTADDCAKEMLCKDFDYIKKNGHVASCRLSYPRGTFCYDYLVKTARLTADAWRAFLDKGLQHTRRNVFLDALDTSDRTILARALAVDDYLTRKAQK